MLTRISTLFICLSLFLLSAASYAVDLKKGVRFRDLSQISADRIYLDLLLNKKDRKALINLSDQNLQNDYIKSMFATEPEKVKLTYIKGYVRDEFEDNRKFLQKKNTTIENFSNLNYIIKQVKTNAIIGSFRIYSNGSDAELGIFISDSMAGNGYGTEATKAAIEFLKKNTTAPEVIWETYPENIGSIRIAEKCGFKLQQVYHLYGNQTVNKYTLSLIEENNVEEHQYTPPPQPMLEREFGLR